ncbi:MAG TPA: hypothetical protein VF322_00415 [Gammaproteobacteria bacterium]
MLDARCKLGRMLAGAAAIAVTFAAGEVRAQPDDVDPFHWGYAAAFGGGDYRLGDGTEARIARARFGVWLRETPEEGGMGVRLLLPVTVGIQNLDDDAVPPGRPTDRLEEVSFMPGVLLEHNLGEHWTLRTQAQLGWGKELRGDEESAVIGGVGIRSRLRLGKAPGRPALIGGLLWAGFDLEGGERRSLLRLTQALEFEIPVPQWRFRGRPMRLLPHVLGDWYYRPPPALAFGDDDAEKLDSEWQIGLAAGRDGGFQILIFKFESVGVAYRFSDQSEGLRLYLNSVF